MKFDKKGLLIPGIAILVVIIAIVVVLVVKGGLFAPQKVTYGLHAAGDGREITAEAERDGDSYYIKWQERADITTGSYTDDPEDQQMENWNHFDLPLCDAGLLNVQAEEDSYYCEWDALGNDLYSYGGYYCQFDRANGTYMCWREVEDMEAKLSFQKTGEWQIIRYETDDDEGYFIEFWSDGERTLMFNGQLATYSNTKQDGQNGILLEMDGEEYFFARKGDTLSQEQFDYTFTKVFDNAYLRETDGDTHAIRLGKNNEAYMLEGDRKNQDASIEYKSGKRLVAVAYGYELGFYVDENELVFMLRGEEYRIPEKKDNRPVEQTLTIEASDECLLCGEYADDMKKTQYEGKWMWLCQECLEEYEDMKQVEQAIGF